MTTALYVYPIIALLYYTLLLFTNYINSQKDAVEYFICALLWPAMFYAGLVAFIKSLAGK